MDRPEGHARVTMGPAGWSLEVDEDEGPGARAKLIAAALEGVALRGGGKVNLWVPSPGEEDDEAALTAGLVRGRELFQMRRHLPVGEPWDIELRPFVPGQDDEAWLEANNRAFAEHPEQGLWNMDHFHERMAEEWFDPAGFLIHEHDGRVAGFCWTREHRSEVPPLGEIFVVAVDPDFAGMGHGRLLTLAGLDHLASRGLTIGMLYVETTNLAALHLYEELGFTVDHIHRAYTGTVAAA